jgi:hypothetical protein
MHAPAVCCCGYRSQCPRYRVLRFVFSFEARSSYQHGISGTSCCVLDLHYSWCFLLECGVGDGGSLGIPWFVRVDPFQAALRQITWKWVVGFTLWSLCPRRRAPRFQWIGDGWAPGVVRTFLKKGKSLALLKIEHRVLHLPRHCLVTIKITPSRLHFKFEALYCGVFTPCINRFLWAG